MSLVQRDRLNRTGHGLNGKVQCALRKLHRCLAKVLGETVKPLTTRPEVRGLISIRTEHGRERIHLQTPQHQVGIRDREGTTTAITGRPGIGTRRARAHQQTFSVPTDD